MRSLPADGQFGRAPVTQTPVREYWRVAKARALLVSPPGTVTSMYFTPTGIVTLPERLNVARPATARATPVVAAARTPTPDVASPLTPSPAVAEPRTACPEVATPCTPWPVVASPRTPCPPRAKPLTPRAAV